METTEKWEACMAASIGGFCKAAHVEHKFADGHMVGRVVARPITPKRELTDRR